LTPSPFQSPLACVSIPFAKGVCGAAARERKTQLLLDVDSDKLNDFDASDQKYLEAIVELLRKQHLA
jgi:putative methionine-R-sulfoxide reductase with GAF domain